MKKIFHSMLITLLFTVLFILFLNLNSFAAIHGDVDGDGKITASDSRLILRKSLKFSDTNHIPVSVADIDLDGQVTPADSRIVLRASVELTEDLDLYARRKDVINKAFYYKNLNYRATNFKFSYDWCMAFVCRCFRDSRHDPKGFYTLETSCSKQVYYICKNNPQAFTFVMTKAALEKRHGEILINDDRKKITSAKFNSNYIPLVGDVLFIDNRDGYDIDTHIACHTGFVTSVKKVNGKTHIYTIEGNVDGLSKTERTKRGITGDYYTTSRINTKEYVVNSSGCIYLYENGKLNTDRQILGFYTPTFNY